MPVHYLWWVVAIGLGVAELATGSFYLLVLAAGAVAAGLAALAGGSVPVQLIVAAGVSAAGAWLVRRYRRGQAAPATRNADVNLDIGAILTIGAWSPEGRARARYRGAEWDVELMPGEPAPPGRFVVLEVVANRLRVGAADRRQPAS